jgi:hypothetical protein
MCSVITRAGHQCKNGTNCPIHTPAADCPICLNATFKTRSSKTLRCGHRFHANCLQEWRETGGNTCPMCRAQICPSKYRVSFKIQNIETNIEHEQLLNELQIINVFTSLGLPHFTGELDVNVELDEVSEFLENLGVSLSDINPLVFNTE